MRLWRLAVPLYWWLVFLFAIKVVELIHISSKAWWEEFRAEDDAGVGLSFRQEKPRLAFPFFLRPCSWRRRRVPGKSSPRPTGACVRRTIIYYVFIAV